MSAKKNRHIVGCLRCQPDHMFLRLVGPSNAGLAIVRYISDESSVPLCMQLHT